MIDPNSKIGEILEKGQSVADTTISDVSSTVKGQVIGDKKPVSQATQAQSQAPSQQALSQQNTVGESAQVTQADHDRTKEVVNDFYSLSDDIHSQSQAQLTSAANDEQQLAQTRAELKQQQQLAQDQHKEVYYDPLFAYEHKKPEPSKAEVAEEERKVKMEELASTQAKKDKDLAVQRAQTTIEINRGVSG